MAKSVKTIKNNDDLVREKLAQGTGMFLEAAATAELNSLGKYNATRNYTYTHTYNGTSEQNDIDLVASHPDRSADRLIMAVECKREYKVNKYWVIEDSTDFTDNVPELLSVDPTINYNLTNTYIDYGYKIVYQNLNSLNANKFKAYSNIFGVDITNGKVDIEGNEIPYKALIQANAAATAIAQNFSSLPREHYHSQQKLCIVPVIVTTANLRIVSYSVEDIELSKGNIAYDNLDLSPIKWAPLIFTLPHKFQLSGTLGGKSRVQPARRLSFVVQAEHFKEFSAALAGDFDSRWELKTQFAK